MNKLLLGKSCHSAAILATPPVCYFRLTRPGRHLSERGECQNFTLNGQLDMKTAWIESPIKSDQKWNLKRLATLPQNNVWNALFLQVLLLLHMPTVSWHRLPLQLKTEGAATFVSNLWIRSPFLVTAFGVIQPSSLVLQISLFKIPSVVILFLIMPLVYIWRRRSCLIC